MLAPMSAAEPRRARQPDAVAQAIRAERLVAVLRHVPPAPALEAGIRVLEVTLDSEGALDDIRRLRARGDVTVLAGTVRAAADVDAAVAAGAEACVGPGFSPEVVARCRDRGVLAVPGALTPTEVELAWRSGAGLVKLFPGSLGGPDYVRALLAPLAEVPLLVTGGVTPASARGFLDAGAVAVGASVRTADEGRALLEAVRR
jgi:2-dehydro-3-deoxyphosphogluconate aldolase/(4S)-4-hydroxy-2-oxoglutarate aldolase